MDIIIADSPLPAFTHAMLQSLEAYQHAKYMLKRSRHGAARGYWLTQCRRTKHALRNDSRRVAAALILSGKFSHRLDSLMAV